jgi:hypothetical protein
MKNVWVGYSRIYEFGGGKLRERDHWREPGVDLRIILRWICGK